MTIANWEINDKTNSLTSKFVLFWVTKKNSKPAPMPTLYLHSVKKVWLVIVQELSRGGRPGLSVLTSLLVSVDVKLY